MTTSRKANLCKICHDTADWVVVIPGNSVGACDLHLPRILREDKIRNRHRDEYVVVPL